VFLSIVRINFSLKLVAFESLFLSVLFCGSLFLPGFFYESDFYLYPSVAFASDVLGDVSMFIVHYF